MPLSLLLELDDDEDDPEPPDELSSELPHPAAKAMSAVNNTTASVRPNRVMSLSSSIPST
jgi:hypothetical protein